MEKETSRVNINTPGGLAPKHPEWLSVTEVAEAENVTRQGVIRAIEYGRLPAYMVGSQYIIPKSALRPIFSKTAN